MVTTFRTSNMKITLMIVKWKYIGVGIHVLMVVGQKNPGYTSTVLINPSVASFIEVGSKKPMSLIPLSLNLCASILQKKKVRNAKHNH
jgi:hypothetical protein